jgi:carboxypeptidase Q
MCNQRLAVCHVPCAIVFRILAIGYWLLAIGYFGSIASAQEPTETNAPAPRISAGPSKTNDPIARIRDEGLNHSQVMQTLGFLTDVIGPRLTGSPNLKRANEWTRDQLSSWGLASAHLEAWGPFGRGWSLQRFSAQVVEPQTITLIGYPNAWSPGFDQPLMAEVVHFPGGTNANLEKFKGKLAGKIVLYGAVRDVKPAFGPMALRLGETNLLKLANAGEPSTTTFTPGLLGPGRRGAGFEGRTNSSPSSGRESVSLTNAAGSGPAAEAGRDPTRRFRGTPRYLSFLAKEGAALIVTPSSIGDGGTFFVAAATVPGSEGFGGFGSSSNSMRAWMTNAPSIPPQITLAAEDYNRLVRMIQLDQKLKMAVDLQVSFHDDDRMAYNTIAEIPGTDLKDEIVMLGAHLDSWHSGTGATDNGAGVAATMEAVRILAALKLQPRRTIRIGLWSGEEEGLLGSKAYVAKHFGYFKTNSPSASSSSSSSSSPTRTPKDEARAASQAKSSATNTPPRRKLIRESEYEKLAAYFNLDNGAGKIRGVYMQGNEAVRPLFRRWLAPFADLDAETLSLSNTGGTDHLSFDAIGLSGFEFIQDPLDYGSRTHHSNQDVFDRIQADDLKQAATIIAAFVYNAAIAPDKLPRKPVPK